MGRVVEASPTWTPATSAARKERTLTVAETVALSARLRGVGIKRVRAVLLELGLDDVAATRIGDPLATRASQRGISGGERKRVALVGSPACGLGGLPRVWAW